MSYRKNAVSYGIWALYLMGVGIVFSFMGMVAGHQSAGIPYTAITILALAAGALFLVYFLIKRFGARVGELVYGRAVLAEGIAVAVFLAAGMALRLAMMESAGEEAAYYEVAKVTEEGMRVQLVQGSVYYYLCLLNLLFHLVGNKWTAGIVLQILLQTLGTAAAYFAVRCLTGRGPALVSLAFLALSPGSVREGINYSPKMLYFCIYALTLLVIALYLRRSVKPGGKALAWMLALVCGALTAFAGYMDVVGFTLAIPLFGLPTLKRERRDTLYWTAQFLFSMLIMAGVFCLLAQLDSSMSGSTLARVLGAWGVTYGPKGADYSFFFQEGGYETILLLMMMALGIFTFMRRRNEERFSPWVMMVLSITLMRVLGVVTPNMNGSFQMFFAMTGLAGVAFCELFVRDGDGVREREDAGTEAERPGEKRKDAGTEERTVAKRGDAETEAERPGARRKITRQKDRAAEELMFRENKAESGTPGFAVHTAEEKKGMTEKKQDEPRQVQLIENPLPLPRKHVKKVMDYPIAPDASQMHYDIEVDPNDNFDF